MAPYNKNGRRSVAYYSKKPKQNTVTRQITNIGKTTE